MPPAVVFPGQGSQQAGAGRDWLDHPAWSVVERAEAALDVPLAPLLLDLDADLSAPATRSCRSCCCRSWHGRPPATSWDDRSRSPGTRSARSPR